MSSFLPILRDSPGNRIQHDGHSARRQTSTQPTVTLDSVTSSQPLRDGIEIQAGSVDVCASPRCAMTFSGCVFRPVERLPEDASWAVSAELRGKSVEVQATQDNSSVGFRTTTLDVRRGKQSSAPCRPRSCGQRICADAVGRPVKFQLGGFTVSKEMPGRRALLRARRQDRTIRPPRPGLHALEHRRWAAGIGRSALQEHPVFSRASTARAATDFFSTTPGAPGLTSASRRATRYSFGAEGGPLDYYFIYGPTPKQVVESYAYLTGKPPLPPLWALGFQQSRYSYTPESQVREIANRLRADKIPSDVLYLDIDYQDRNRPFTVESQDLPEFPGSGFRSAQAALPSRQDHRSAHRARCQPGIFALRHRSCWRIIS